MSKRSIFTFFALILVLSSFSCTTDTSIFLTIRCGLKIPAEMDGLRIAIDESGRSLYQQAYSLEKQEDLTLSISPGREGEYEIHIQATATKGGTDVAVGEAVALFKKNRKVQAVITLGGDPGDGGTDSGGDGGCTNGCPSKGLTECVTTSSHQACDDHNNDGCIEWGQEIGCGLNEACSGGSCGCLVGYENCDKEYLGGCESKLSESLENCGKCGVSCSPERLHAAGTSCNQGHCDYTECDSEYVDIDNDRSTGCETWSYYPRLYRGVDPAGVRISAAGKGLVLATTTKSFGAGDADIWLFKLSVNGEAEWQRTYGSSGFETQAGATAAGSGYALSGYTNTLGSSTSGYNAWVSLLDDTGEPVWQKMLGGTQGDYAVSISTCCGGDLLMLGRTQSAGEGGEDIWLARIDLGGVVKWQKVYGGEGDDTPTGVMETSDGDLMIVGTVTPPSSGTKGGLVLKVKANGDLAAAKEIDEPSTGFFKPVSIVESYDGGFILVGTVSQMESMQDVTALRLNRNLDIEKQVSLGGAKAEMAAVAVATTGGGALICGYTESEGAGKRDILAAKVSGDGSLEWQKTFGGAENDSATSMVEGSDGYYIGGVTESFGATGSTVDAIVLKLNDDGTIPGDCGMGLIRDSTLSVGTPSLVAKTADTKSSDVTMNGVDTSATVKSTSVTPEMKCGN